MSNYQNVTSQRYDSLAQRLELLEPRFTTPSHRENMDTTDLSPQVSTVMGSATGSPQHSIGFDTSIDFGCPGSSRSSPTFNLDKSLIRPKKQRVSPRISSFEKMKLAAERQMQRVVARSPSLMDSSSEQNSNAESNQTILTSHKSSQEESSRIRVIAESPPFLTSSLNIQSPSIRKETMDAVDKSTPMIIDKRKSVPIKRPQPSVTEAVQSTTSPTVVNTTRKRTRLNFIADEAQIQTKLLTEISSNSRSNPGKASKKRGSENNSDKNRKINYFFVSSKKSSSDTTKQGSEEQTRETHTTGLDSEIKVLRARCEELEKMVEDKDEQLRAVANNQTITNAALKASLCQRERELEDMKKSKVSEMSRLWRLVEKLIRSENTRDRSELRQKLASDGARLGRIVHTRVGLRSVESWEEGHASKTLYRKKLDLENKKEILLNRQSIVEKAAKTLSDGKQVNESSAGLILDNALSILEANESLKMHLNKVLEEEQILRKEEAALNSEKAEHIRELKRVASEDASRFRSRPKLNDRYMLLSLLGKGGFSEVWRAFDIIELREVAVKIHQLDPRWNEAKKDNYTKHVSREYEIHRAVRHPRIVSLFDVFEIDNNAFATVLELCNGTDLDSLLKEKKCLPEKYARAILLQVLSGMNYLSHKSGDRQGIIHYDLKPGNILFDEFGDAKITDFGLSKIVDAPDSADSLELTSQGAGTYWYLPPECFITNETVRISNKVDVWSIGVIFYQMLFGKRPFGDGLSQDRVLTDNTMLNAREVQFNEDVSVSKEAKDFIQLCLTYDQAFRPTIGQICNHSYILPKT